jgi:hypothetical protein
MKMNNKIHQKTAYAQAYARWFSGYERERRRQHRRPGATLAGFPPPPTAPADIAAAVDAIGPRVALDTLQIHRATLARWLSGEVTIPRAAWLVLSMLAAGRLPTMSDAWQDFRFVGDRLTLVGTRYAWTAQEIAGIPYLQAHADSLAARVADLESQLRRVMALNATGAANDPIARTG